MVSFPLKINHKSRLIRAGRRGGVRSVCSSTWEYQHPNIRLVTVLSYILINNNTHMNLKWLLHVLCALQIQRRHILALQSDQPDVLSWFMAEKHVFTSGFMKSSCVEDMLLLNAHRIMLASLCLYRHFDIWHPGHLRVQKENCYTSINYELEPDRHQRDCRRD